MRYSQETIDRLVEQVDILDIARRYIDSLENRGGRWWGRCPFHDEKTPSFTLNPERKSFYCFGCQEKGGVIKLLMQLEHLSFPEALKKLAEQYGFTLPQQNESGPEVEARRLSSKKKEALYRVYSQVHKYFRQNLRSERGKIAQDYLRQRGVAGSISDLFELGYAVDEPRSLYHWLREQNYSAEILAESGLFSQRNTEICLFWQRLIFPVFDAEGRVIAFSGRQLSADDPKSPKYINSRESLAYRKSECLFGLYQSLKSLRRQRSLILCEGNLDVLAWHQADIANAAAPLGTAFTAEQAKLLKRYCDKVVLAFDGDEAGQKAIYKAAFLLEQEEISSQIIPLAPGRDPADILQHEGEKDLKSLAQTPLDFFSFLSQDLEQRFALTELTGVSAALRFLAPFMAQIKEGLRRELYIAQFAKLFGLKQEVLAAEPSWRYSPQRRSREAVAPTGDEADKRQTASSPAQGAGQAPGPVGNRSNQRYPGRRQLNSDMRAELVEREFWASMLLQADLYPEWQEELGQCPWESEDAILLKELLDRAAAEQGFNFETLRDRVSRKSPELGQWLLQKKLEPLQDGSVSDSEGYEISSYRRTILEQKYCGLQEFWLKQRRVKVLRQIQNLEAQNRETAGSDDQLISELLRESQSLDARLAALKNQVQLLQSKILPSSQGNKSPILENS